MWPPPGGLAAFHEGVAAEAERERLLMEKDKELAAARGTINVLQHQLVDNLAGRPYDEARGAVTERLMRATHEEVEMELAAIHRLENKVPAPIHHQRNLTPCVHHRRPTWRR